MSEQLAFDLTKTEPSAWETIYAAACAAVDLNTRAGFADFTTGRDAVTVDHADTERIVLTTDNRWAASAIRTALRRSGAAVEADPGNESTTVTVCAISEDQGTTQVETHLAEERDQHGRTILLLDGPDGTVEQQCGAGGHNDLIVHAQHPFPSSARINCPRHGDGCWIRSDWPWSQRTVRSCVRSVVTEAGYTWQIDSEATTRMHDIYLRNVHQHRPSAAAPTFRLDAEPPARPAAPIGPAEASPPRPPACDPRPPVPRVVDVIRDVADYAT
ncbi:hypothetical protein ABZ329_29240 [Streptomyces rubiginosohelvolus]|uniref:hypothetical protein n=1 Tax=Streptomyces rubiginosohelvolus TaxID=67362 RepID=UPI0033D8B83B